ncbi:hypothetical protein Pav013_2197 [Pseudomonas syringae pv. avellanae str. ISPaVe013]|nr:hypothetical protein Pav013_2197 [Pseudomonas syringae pv. avellanae str. ISPaVe013]
MVLSATLGIAIAPMDGSDPDLLLQRADSAMYRGKTSGRARFHFYEVSFEREQRLQEQFARELTLAIEEKDIQPFYQPIVSLPEQRLAGFELLARWLHPERGIILPLDFIPVAEQLGLIKPLTATLLLQAFDQARDWPSDFTLAINVTSLMIESPDFPDWLATHECDFAQGYLFGRPLPLAQVKELLAMSVSEGPVRALAVPGK